MSTQKNLSELSFVFPFSLEFHDQTPHEYFQNVGIPDVFSPFCQNAVEGELSEPFLASVL